MTFLESSSGQEQPRRVRESVYDTGVSRRAGSLSLAVLSISLTLAWEVTSAAQTSEGPTFTRHAIVGQATTTAVFEAWDYNLSEEWFGGGSVALWYFVLDGLAVGVEATFVRVNQDAFPDSLLRGVSEKVRWHFIDRRQASLFAEAGIGASWSRQPVPRRGTKFNYLLHAGGGTTARLSRRTDLIVEIRWFHVSNNGREGRNRNPDIQALGGNIGILVRF